MILIDTVDTNKKKLRFWFNTHVSDNSMIQLNFDLIWLNSIINRNKYQVWKQKKNSGQIQLCCWNRSYSTMSAFYYKCWVYHSIDSSDECILEFIDVCLVRAQNNRSLCISARQIVQPLLMYIGFRSTLFQFIFLYHDLLRPTLM